MENNKANSSEDNAHLRRKARKLATYMEGATLYRIPYYTFVRLAKEARASFAARNVAMVELDVFEDYLNEHPDILEKFQTRED